MYIVNHFERNLIRLCKNMKGLGNVVDDEMQEDNKLTFSKYFKRKSSKRR